MQCEAIPVKRRCDDPVGIDDAHNQDEQGNGCDPANMTFFETRQEKKKGNKEVESDQCRRNPFPAMVETAQIPLNLFRKIARPDDEQL